MLDATVTVAAAAATQPPPEELAECSKPQRVAVRADPASTDTLPPRREAPLRRVSPSSVRIAPPATRKWRDCHTASIAHVAAPQAPRTVTVRPAPDTASWRPFSASRGAVTRTVETEVSASAASSAAPVATEAVAVPHGPIGVAGAPGAAPGVEV